MNIKELLEGIASEHCNYILNRIKENPNTNIYQQIQSCGMKLEDMYLLILERKLFFKLTEQQQDQLRKEIYPSMHI